MANTVIQVKFSTNTATPPSLNIAEPAYSYTSNTLFIGAPTGQGVIPIGGKLYLDQQQTIYNQVNAAFSAANSSAGLASAYNTANAAFAEANSKPDYTVIRQPFYSKASNIRLSANAFIGNTTVSVQTVVAGQQVGTYLQYNDHISFDDTDTIFTVLSVANPAAQTSLVVLNKPLDANAFSANTVIYGILGNQYGTVTELVIDGGLQFSLGGGTTANTAIIQTNDIVVTGAFIQANAAFDTANAAFASANSVSPQVQPIFNTANAAFLHANNSYNTANLAYSQANTANLIARSAFDSSNTKITSVIARTRLINSGATLNQTTTIDNQEFFANVGGGNIISNYFTVGDRVKIGNPEYTITSIFAPSSNISLITISGSITEVVSAGAIIYKYASYGNVTNIVIDAGLSIDSVGNSTVVISSNTAVAAFDKANAAFNRANTSALSVSLVDDANVFTNNITQVTGLRFDSNSGFDITDLGSGNVRIGMNSTFKTWKIAGQQDLIANGLDTIAFVGSNGVSITSNTASIPKSIIFDTRSLFDVANGAYNQANTKVSKSGDTMTGDLKFGSGGGILNLPTNQIAITANVDNDVSGFIAFATGVSTVYANTDVIIQANTGGATFSQWNFNRDGTVAFPDSTVQSTAFTGYGTDNVARNTTNASFIRANNSLDANNGGIVTGNVTVTQNLTVTGNISVSGNLFTSIPANGNTSAYATKYLVEYNPVSREFSYSSTPNASNPYITGYSSEIHVSPVAFNDSGKGTIGDPVKTIARAKELLALAFETTGAGQRKTIILHPGDYVEDVTIDTQFTVLTSHELIGKSTTLTGTLTLATGCTIEGLKMTNLVISATAATGTIDLIGCTVTTSATKTSSAYTVFRGCDLSSATLSVTGAGNTILIGGNYGSLTVNNASAGVLAKAVITMGPTTLTAGTLQISDTIVYSATNSSNAITQSVGSVLTLNNSQILIPTLTNVARVNLGGFYSILHSVYDKANSALSGTSINSISYSQYINADKVTLSSGGSLVFPDSTIQTTAAAPYAYSNASFVQANASFIIANSAAIAANTPSSVANNAWNTANAAFIRANNSLDANNGGTVSGNVTFASNVVVQGNLTVLGSAVTLNTSSLSVTDTLLFLGANNFTSDAVEIGLVASYNDGANAHTGLIRDPNLKEWLFFKNYTPEVTSNNLIDLTHPSFAYANVRAGTFKGNVESNSVSILGYNILNYINAAFSTANSAAAGSVDQSARNTANGAFASANSAAIAANTPSSVANAAYNQANAAFIIANSAAIAANTPSGTANAAFDKANSAAIAANTPSHVANSASVYANAAFTRANNSINANTGGTITGNLVVIGNVVATVISTSGVSGNITGADNIFANTFYANNIDLFAFANAAYNQANSASAGSIDQTARNTANAAFASANNVAPQIQPAFNAANAAFIIANSAAIAANTPSGTANAAFTRANNSINANTGGTITGNLVVVGNVVATVIATSGTSGNITGADNIYANTFYAKNVDVLSYINAAFSTANSAAAGSVDQSARNTANAAFLHANAAFIAANTGTGATGAYNQANAAYTRANNSINANTGGTITGNLVVIGNVVATVISTSGVGSGDITGANNVYANTVYANSVDLFAFANAAFNTANAATSGSIDQTARNTANAAFAAANSSSGSAGAYDTANAAFIAANNALNTNLTQNNSIIAAFNTANAAFIAANTGTGATGAYNHANAAFTRANNSINANTGGTVTGNLVVVGNVVATIISTSGSGTGDITGANNIYANTVYANNVDLFTFANAAFNTANAVSSGNLDQTARNTANAAFLHANAAFAVANTGGGATSDTYARNTANAAFDVANSAAIAANTPSSVANNAWNTANAAFTAANTGTGATGAYNTANAAFIRANNSINANTGGTITGNLVVVGNVVATVITTSGVSGNITGADNIYANTLYAKNVDVLTYINAAFNTANSASAGSVDQTSRNTANAAFTRANNSINANTGGTVTGNLVVVGNVVATIISTSGSGTGDITGANNIYANAVFTNNVDIFKFANAAFNTANSAASGSVDQTARNTANAAFTAANTGTGAAGAYNQANAAFLHANAAFNAANSSSGSVGAYNQANAAFTRANNSINANTGGTITGNLVVVGNVVATLISTSGSGTGDITGANNIFANTFTTYGASGNITGVNNIYANTLYAKNIDVLSYINAAFNVANSGGGASSDSFARNTANAAFITANAAFITANNSAGTDLTQNNSITAAFNHANAAFIAANTGGSAVDQLARNTANAAFITGNVAVNQANAAFDVANSAAIAANTPSHVANSAAIAANTPSHVANSAGVYANGAFVQANAAFASLNANVILIAGVDTSQNISITAAFNTGNSAFIAANSAGVYANGAFIQANNAWTTGNYAFNHANSGFIQANAAYIHVNASFNHANSGFIQANSAFHHANSAFDTANSKAYIFYQDYAPATSNAHDLWVNSETGTTYENFGTPFSPIWAEFGPTNSVANTPPATQTYATLNITSALVFSSNQSQLVAYQGYGVDNLARSVANSTAIRANNSLNANNGGTVTANVVVVGNVHANLFITNGSGGDISNANTVFSNTVSTGNVTVSTLLTSANVVVNNNITVKANTTVLGNVSVAGELFVTGGAPWLSYTPSWTTSGTAPALGNGTITGKYKQIGKTIFVRVHLSLGSTSTTGTGNFRFTLPITASSSDGVVMPATFLDNGVNWYMGTVTCAYDGSTSYVVPLTSASPSGAVTASVPFTWATGDALTFNGSYEAV